MLFQSQIFALVFLPAVLAGYWLFARSPAIRQWILIAASLVFYGWWDIRFLPLLIGHALVTWSFARLYAGSGRAALLWVAIALNLASLATFKYLDFVVVNIEAASGLDLPRSELVLPIGISFFTFQLISYLADLKRGAAPTYRLREFALFATFFPQLIAGPIVRHNEIIGQFALDPWRDGLNHRMAAGEMNNNPSPGNKQGGLTTILEKSLGAAAKGGSTPLTAVYEYAELIREKGFVFMDTPGYDRGNRNPGTAHTRHASHDPVIDRDPLESHDLIP